MDFGCALWHQANKPSRWLYWIFRRNNKRIYSHSLTYVVDLNVVPVVVYIISLIFFFSSGLFVFYFSLSFLFVAFSCLNLSVPNVFALVSKLQNMRIYSTRVCTYAKIVVPLICIRFVHILEIWSELVCQSTCVYGYESHLLNKAFSICKSSFHS